MADASEAQSYASGRSAADAMTRYPPAPPTSLAPPSDTLCCFALAKWQVERGTEENKEMAAPSVEDESVGADERDMGARSGATDGCSGGCESHWRKDVWASLFSLSGQGALQAPPLPLPMSSRDIRPRRIVYFLPFHDCTTFS